MSCQLAFDKGTKVIQWRKGNLRTNCAEVINHILRDMNLHPLHHIYEITKNPSDLVKLEIRNFYKKT